MRIIGHGIDIQSIPRVEQRLQDPHRDWIDGAFTEAEQKAADAPPNSARCFAGRYAAKEAVAKALGTGFSDDVAWLDIEILRSDSGSPTVFLSEGAAKVASELHIDQWLVSISHSGDYAIASAIAVGPDSA